MFLKKRISIFLTVVFLLSIILPQIALAQTSADIAVIEDLAQIELHVFGEVKEDALLSRVEFLEKELVGRTLPGILKDRVKQLKDFIVIGTLDEPSLSFKVNSAQWTLQDEITDEPLLIKIENLELKIFGELSEEVLAMRAEKIFTVCFPEGRPNIQDITIPAGTLIPIILLESIGSKKSDDGDIFEYQVAEDIVYSGSIIIPKNTVARGEVLKAKRASVLLKKGKLEIDFKSIEALDGTNIRLIMGEAAEEENSRLGIAIGASIAGLIILSNPIGLVAGALIPGKNITLKEGTKIYLEVATDTKIISLVQ
ncbi:MAG: hypothetical protein PHI72_07665 [Atribacterota bacterium]|jgi:hypothetical protein|nr:hypothetical protein [Atribacterota bacterium]MDD4895485.1 hypothetical protein [Atribacterota bacterium]MDD5637862.1 hypothetical protein [Atribacterota bacterium]